MRRNQGCNPLEHEMARRRFLTSTVAGAAGIGLVDTHAQADQLKHQQKRILQVFLQGGVSQLESWDPKPGTVHGGPFQAIPTSVPGIHISELLPNIAQRMHLLSIVRSINIKINDHEQGRQFMEKGRRVGQFPYVGAVASKYLATPNSNLPGYVHVSSRGLSDVAGGAAFLGAKHGQLKLEGIKPPGNLSAPAGIDAVADASRDKLRLQFNQRFADRRSKAMTEAYDASYDQAAGLMERRAMFEGTASKKDLERYGTHDFGRYCLLARTLLENGAACVKVTHHGYDSHAENFNFHLEQLGEFDRPFCMLLDDLETRGMLESTLVVIYSEFGRTPKVNVRYGRDHWGTAWSIALGGCGIQPGAVIGSTNETGTEVADREVDASHLFHTYLQAVGLDSTAEHDLPGRSIPIGDPATESIQELLV
ncbi:MAG: DUF1501 domain-containing protein [Fuerstiella sp.]|jgi:uncharacterized protein (DUF1501 family)|nr:DUF1501 domain-containing protein [Fuerstiella sp.]